MSPLMSDARSSASFLRGLTLGALIGAIIAGSSIWSLRRRRRDRPAASET
jgi:LPXTG-motif cell wall-anchored protein